MLLDRGYYEITGLAWSGRGKVKRVDVSADGGRNWRTARLQEPVLTKALTRFRLDWSWDGAPALLQVARDRRDRLRAADAFAQLRAVRGTRSIYHNNAIQTWRCDPTARWAMSRLHSALCCARVDRLPAFRGRRAAARASVSAARRRRRRSPRGTSTCVPTDTGFRRAGARSRRARRSTTRKCASCHGTFGESNQLHADCRRRTQGRYEDGPRVGAAAVRRTAHAGNKLNYATTLWDYIYRAMPWANPQSLSVDEVYAVTAYVLHLNEIVPAEYELNEKTLLSAADAEPRWPDDSTRARAASGHDPTRRAARA